MSAKLLLYFRADCCLCEAMKAVIREVAAKIPLDLEEVDVDSFPQLKELFSDEVPALFVEDRKVLEQAYSAEINALEPRMELRMEASRQSSVTDARAKKFKPQELFDRRYLDQMEKSGFIDELWRGANPK